MPGRRRLPAAAAVVAALAVGGGEHLGGGARQGLRVEEALPVLERGLERAEPLGGGELLRRHQLQLAPDVRRALWRSQRSFGAANLDTSSPSGALTLATLFVLACSLAAAPSSNAPAFDPTKAALELQATQMSQQLTQAALNASERMKPSLPVLSTPVTSAPCSLASWMANEPAPPPAPLIKRFGTLVGRTSGSCRDSS